MPQDNNMEKKAISDLGHHKPPADYHSLDVTPAMVKLMTNLALNHDFLAQYYKDPAELAKSTTGLNDTERRAIESCDPNKMRLAMRGSQDLQGPWNIDNTVEIVVQDAVSMDPLSGHD